jgi:hypothetical protein
VVAVQSSLDFVLDSFHWGWSFYFYYFIEVKEILLTGTEETSCFISKFRAVVKWSNFSE